MAKSVNYIQYKNVIIHHMNTINHDFESHLPQFYSVQIHTYNY